VSDPHSKLGAISALLGYQLRRVDLVHMQLVRRQLSAVGLTPARATALAFIGANPGCAQTELGKVLGINRASTMELVNRLVDAGWVERRAAADRRRHALHLTASGMQQEARFVAQARQVEAALCRGLTAAEQKQLVELLARVRAGVESISG
jgi:DNA-binding MarR family transcriptional regulator